MWALVLRLVGLAACVVAVALVYLEAGSTEPPLVMPVPHGSFRDAPSAEAPPPTARSMRFLFGGGGGSPRHVAGLLQGVPRDHVVPIGLPPSALVADEAGTRFSFDAPPGDLIGFGLLMKPGALHWDWTLDDAPWPADAVFAGPYGLAAPELLHGIGASCLHGFATGPGTPYFSADRLGAFVVCEDK